jgi:hypothetical protein
LLQLAETLHRAFRFLVLGLHMSRTKPPSVQ